MCLTNSQTPPNFSSGISYFVSLLYKFLRIWNFQIYINYSFKWIAPMPRWVVRYFRWYTTDTTDSTRKPKKISQSDGKGTCQFAKRLYHVNAMYQKWKLYEIGLYRIKIQPFYSSTSSCILTRIYIRVRTSENVHVSLCVCCHLVSNSSAIFYYTRCFIQVSDQRKNKSCRSSSSCLCMCIRFSSPFLFRQWTVYLDG